MAKTYCHISLVERMLIEARLSLGMSPGAIALDLARARSTVLREIERNGWRGLHRADPLRVAGQYRAVRPIARRCGSRRGAAAGPAQTPVGHAAVVDGRLREGLSPQQIAGTLKLS